MERFQPRGLLRKLGKRALIMRKPGSYAQIYPDSFIHCFDYEIWQMDVKTAFLNGRNLANICFSRSLSGA